VICRWPDDVWAVCTWWCRRLSHAQENPQPSDKLESSRFCSSTILDVDLPPFIPGLELARAFHREEVDPIVARSFPSLRHGAALLGNCSDVLGFDTPQSRDHEWGPRVLLLLADEDSDLAPEVVQALATELPVTFRGYPTNFGPPGERIRRMTPVERGPVDHRIEVTTFRSYCNAQLGFDPLDTITVDDWFATSQQRLLTMVAGDVFRDDLGQLAEARLRLGWYPDDVWLALMARQWGRIAEREAFPGRAAAVQDELGCRLLTAALVRDLIHLVFLLERRYAPYSKWLGTAFADLPAATELQPHLERALTAEQWPDREAALAYIYEAVARRHNDLGVTQPLEPTARDYHERTYRVISGERFADALRAQISDPAARQHATLGGIDQWVDAVEVLESPKLSRQAAHH
jgi:hypothetical protein